MSLAADPVQERSEALLKPHEGGPQSGRRWLLPVMLTLISLIWLFPLLLALVNSFRDYAFTAKNGYVSWGGFTLDNYTNAWQQADFGLHFTNSAIITIPAVILTLFNLLPPQALLIPVYRMFRAIEVPLWISDSGTLLNSFVGLILVNMAFQIGFCAFVLSNYMKALPKELYESAVIDGASVTRQFFQITLPLCRPALAALAVLQTTWIYNEFFWATVLLQQGDKFPVTSSLNNLRGQFFTDNNLVAAGSMIVAIPTLVIFFVLQRHFVAGLTLGATKG
ncbi:MAG: carbohydrate ABC transporter permease [Terrabacter sp.]|nr:carbohydrate ABC transporter permease [Terrabacter sp.]